MSIYKTAKFAPVWTTILKIWAIFVHQTLNEHALSHDLRSPHRLEDALQGVFRKEKFNFD